jgi:dolichol-phosphate mannosyltransferase
MKIVIILPTYNERENISDLISALQNQFKQIPDEMHILVVDDNSPDGTGEIVKEEMKKYENIQMLTGEKKGLGTAYIRGMNYAADHLSADAVMEMDADFSHKPADVPRMVAALKKSDFVVGSRYIYGGKIPDNWSLYRKLNSKWGNIFARYIAGIPNIRDCTAGFRAIRTSLLRKIDLNTLKVQGYSFQMNLLYRAVLNDASVIEIPVEFVDRQRGKTKLSVADIVEFILNAWWIRLEKSETFIKFLAVGATGVLVNLGSLTLLINRGINKFIASPISIELSIITNFLFNNYWTFSKRKNQDRKHIKGLKFNVISFLALGVSYTTFTLLSLIWPEISPQLAQAIGIIPATFVNYFFNSYWTFAEK